MMKPWGQSTPDPLQTKETIYIHVMLKVVSTNTTK